MPQRNPMSKLHKLPCVLRLTLLLRPFRISIHNNTHRTTRHLRITTGRRIIINGMFFRLRICLRFQGLRKITNMFTTSNASSHRHLFRPSIKARASTLRPRFRILIQNTTNRFLYNFRNKNRMTRPFSIRLITITRFFTTGLHRTICHIRRITRHRQTTNVRTIMRLPRNCFPIRRQTKVRTSLFENFLVDTQVLMPIV